LPRYVRTQNRRRGIFRCGTEVSDCFRLRFNDGAIDCMGRFWAGSMFEYVSTLILLTAALTSLTMGRNLGV